MEVVNRLGWNLYTRLNRSCIEIEQTVRPTGRPRLHQQSNHLKIHVPVPCVHLRSFLAQARLLRESLHRRNPRPELVDITTEVANGCGELFVRQPRLVWRNQLKDT
jgi:hypothetical protein